MENRNGRFRTLILMITAALFVVLGISVVAFLSSREGSRDAITLPPEGWQPSDEMNASAGEGFVTVTKENAGQVVLDLKRPDCYHQTLSQTTSSDAASGHEITEIWVCGGVQKIVTTSGGQKRHILTDGKTAYLWYQDENWRVDSVTLPEGVTPDDLSGVLTYESIADIPPEEIREAAYQVLTELSDAPCLYVASENGAGVTTRFWVDLSTGLLCRAESLLSDSRVYLLEQTGLSVLAQNDAALQKQMLLPDGTQPLFTASEETPQE